jgi:hypothetical protein
MHQDIISELILINNKFHVAFNKLLALNVPVNYWMKTVKYAIHHTLVYGVKHCILYRVKKKKKKEDILNSQIDCFLLKKTASNANGILGSIKIINVNMYIV